MNAKVIKTQEEYNQALARLSDLMDAEFGTAEGDELELLSVLIEKYEEEHFTVALPDPIEAIKFRMEQQGLTRKDLVPYIGSQSKVSEVLNHKRPLSLAMIRALNAGLGIPADVLLQESYKDLEPQKYNYLDYPFTDMFNQSYFSDFKGPLAEAKLFGEELLNRLFDVTTNLSFKSVYCRQSATTRQSNNHESVTDDNGTYQVEKEGKTSNERKINENALAAWHARALTLAEGQELPPYDQRKITKALIQDVVSLSYYPNGPLMAREILKDSGIAFVLLDHLPHTYLDGASFKTASGRAVIGMTFRFDRLDNFWFTLIHELCHVYLHFEDNFAFFDDTENSREMDITPIEQQANEMAWEMLIPSVKWKKVKLLLHTLADDQIVLTYSEKWRISPAIVAGRIRWETKEYTRHTDLIGNKKVRKLFYSDQGE